MFIARVCGFGLGWGLLSCLLGLGGFCLLVCGFCFVGCFMGVGLLAVDLGCVLLVVVFVG